MKKHFLYILLCSLALSLLGAGNAFSYNSGEISQKNSLSVFQFPQDKSALHANHHINASGSFYRTQGGPASLPASEFKLAQASNLVSGNIAGSANFSFKDYLDHNYPSHNFW